jgi:predicted alpha/beta hydrolase
MVAGAVGPHRTGATSVTAAGRGALFLVVAWLLAAVALLAIQGMLGAYLLAVGAATLAGLGLRALVRWHRAPSYFDRPTPPALPERYRAADDLRRPVADVVAAAEREAVGRQ